jgi:hypothetical protein
MRGGQADSSFKLQTREVVVTLTRGDDKARAAMARSPIVSRLQQELGLSFIINRSEEV